TVPVGTFPPPSVFALAALDPEPVSDHDAAAAPGNPTATTVTTRSNHRTAALLEQLRVADGGDVDGDREDRALARVVGGVAHADRARQWGRPSRAGGEIEGQAALISEGDAGGGVAGSPLVRRDRAHSLLRDGRDADRERVRVGPLQLARACGALVVVCA